MEWKFTEERPLRVFEAFAGYGSQAMALRNLGVPYEVVGISEIDKHAIHAYKAVHGDVNNYGDVTKIVWSEVEDFDLLTYSSPCQDFSNAGLGAGGEEGSGTRSSLLWEVKRPIEEKHPGWILFENVKGFISGKNLDEYKKLYAYLSEQGYSVFAQVLNAKDYGVPQNRERCFIVAIYGDAWYTFPVKRELKTRLEDLLEENVDAKYYLSQEKVEKFLSQLSSDNLTKKAYGVSRTRDKNGKIIKQDILDWTMCIHTMLGGGWETMWVLVFIIEQKGAEKIYRLRKLTYRDAGRLMGVRDEDITKMVDACISNTHLYKCFGNSIVVPVLEGIFTQMFRKDSDCLF